MSPPGGSRRGERLPSVSAGAAARRAARPPPGERGRRQRPRRRAAALPARCRAARPSAGCRRCRRPARAPAPRSPACRPAAATSAQPTPTRNSRTIVPTPYTRPARGLPRSAGIVAAATVTPGLPPPSAMTPGPTTQSGCAAAIRPYAGLYVSSSSATGCCGSTLAMPGQYAPSVESYVGSCGPVRRLARGVVLRRSQVDVHALHPVAATAPIASRTSSRAGSTAGSPCRRRRRRAPSRGRRRHPGTRSPSPSPAPWRP